MPELAEVEHSRRKWNPGVGKRVQKVIVRRPDGRVYRDTDVQELQSRLVGKRLMSSEARGKQMIFRFSGEVWVGIHLGMSGNLRCEDSNGAQFEPRKHDYFILRMSSGSTLVFEDLRLFGRVRFHSGREEPDWWNKLPPSVTSPEFTFDAMADFLRRRSRTSLKAVFLMQEWFPGVGNWMADEILWRARINPATKAGDLERGYQKALYRSVRWVCAKSVEIMDEEWNYPSSWLFSHRWQKRGDCPRCKTVLARGTIGGRTTAWCPCCQPLKGSRTKSGRKPKRDLVGKKSK
jgi:formamidopyrimidine-DNA glycosylase